MGNEADKELAREVLRELARDSVDDETRLAAATCLLHVDDDLPSLYDGEQLAKVIAEYLDVKSPRAKDKADG